MAVVTWGSDVRDFDDGSVMTYLKDLAPALQVLIIIGAGGVAGLIVHAVAFRILTGLGHRWGRFEWMTAERLRMLRAPTRFLSPIVGAWATAPLWRAPLEASTVETLFDVLFAIGVIGVAWLLIRIVDFANSIVLERYRLDVEDNLHHRKVVTNVQLARRLADVVIVIVAISAILLSFERFRQLGAGLLASAGIAGIVFGFAAQRTLGTLLAGFQIAWTQPIRVDDVVIVEGEWGRVEEITLTYAVVKIWDQRRLVVPISHFIENSVENWTRSSSDLLGTVYLYADYTVDFDAIREELQRVCEASEHWDERLAKIHVTNVDEKTVEVRCLVSAADASTAWELRCEVREKLVRFLQESQPDALPVHRARLEKMPTDDPAASTSKPPS